MRARKWDEMDVDGGAGCWWGRGEKASASAIDIVRHQRGDFDGNHKERPERQEEGSRDRHRCSRDEL